MSDATESTLSIHHPSLGNIQGIHKDGVAQFLGIKYATLKHVFAASELVTPSSSGTIDATKIGPIVPGPMDSALQDEFSFIQHSLPLPEPPLRISELDGLNLSVTVPFDHARKLRTEGRKLPVFVYVHGGGFGLGSSSWPQYDLARIVRLSKNEKRPVIGVGINYRIGIPGFLTSEELRAAGCPTNNGLRDQINAFRWVKQYISGFEGDPEEVTFIGESAGAISGHNLLHHQTPLFKRFISMSGNTLMMRPLPDPLTDFVYRQIMEQLELGHLSGQERIDALLKVPVEKLIAAGTSGLPIMPCMDGVVIPCIPTFGQIGSKEDDPTLKMPGRKWCKEIILGDCQFDGSILAHMLGPRTQIIGESFPKSIKASLSHTPGAAGSILTNYQIDITSASQSTTLRNVLQFATDLGFFATNMTWASGWPGKVYLYHFNEKNPWDGPWKGKAGHVLDVAYLFQNFEEFMSEEQKKVGSAFAKGLLGFVNGNMAEEWKEWAQGREGAMCFGPSSDGVTEEFVEGLGSERSGRKGTILKLGQEIGWEELSGAWGNFLAGN